MLNYSWILFILLHSAFSQTTDKYSDEDRPYKFGFNIQGYQHRQEEKDERGLIKGEYGFITADGYYRVTVYATDENGDFKILSMKNYYVGFPPEDPTTTPGPPQRSSNARQPLSNPSFGSRQGPTGRALGGDDSSAKPPKPAKPFAIPQGLAACSDCSIPTTTTRTNQDSLANTGDFRSGRKESESFGGIGQGRGGQSPSNIPGGSARGQASPRGNLSGRGGQFSQETPGGPAGVRFPQGSPRANVQQLSGGFGNDNPNGAGGIFGGGNGKGQDPGLRSNPNGGVFGSRDSSFPKGRNDFPGNDRLGGTPGQRPRIGEVRDGLPPGVTIHDIRDLLYTFNYTVGFHGHHEDGYRNGDKQGDYFFDGRDGVERKVEYLANEFGFQPNITLIDLPENDVRRPNEQTEKEYGLKGYEFKWFYRK